MTSDPGTSSILVPFCKTNGLYFDDKDEPEDFMFNLEKDIDETLLRDDDCYNIHHSYDSVESYFDYHLWAHDLNKQLTFERKENLEEMYTIEINIEDDEI